MKHLVTHIRPHLDDIAGIWLFKKYDPLLRDAEVTFTEVNISGGVTLGSGAVDTDPDYIHIGVCRGRFDEHAIKNPTEPNSAATLVFKHLQQEDKLPHDPVAFRALSLLIDYILQEDSGQTRSKELSSFTAGSIIQGMTLLQDTDTLRLSHEMYNLGVTMLESLLRLCTARAELEHDWERRVEFSTAWGRGVALETTSAEADKFAYTKGFVVIALVHPVKHYKQYRADARSTVDLSSIYRTIHEAEPEAEWYLHQSKKMLICGHDIAPSTKLSQLTLQQLIDFIKK